MSTENVPSPIWLSFNKDEQMYRFIDNSGHCFDDFAKIEDSTEYHKLVADLLKESHMGDKTFSVGDMLCFRDELLEDGFKWSVDFYIMKVK